MDGKPESFSITKEQQEALWAASFKINALARIKGFWDTGRSTPEMLCLIHSEISEALEADRDGDGEMLAEELADAVIRIFDMACGLGINIGEEIAKKHQKNLDRPRLHGRRY